MYGSLTDLTRRRLGLAALAALVVCAALSPASAQAPSSRPSVAVLPLETSDAAQAFFAEGMTDEIAAALTGVLGLDVVARSSSFQLKPPNRDLKSIGQSLNASHLVQGKAQLAGDRVRFDLRLPAVHSLKEKRAVIRPIIDGARNRFQVAAAGVA